MELTFKELLEAINGKVVVDNTKKEFNSICTDTRKIEKNNVFLALKGENFNGNKYVKDAIEKGASVAIVDEVLFNKEEINGNVIKVDNTYDALLKLAKYYREKLNVKVVGITGSTGKTSTKDLVASFLQGKYEVFKTKGNFNNHIGLPLMILSMDPEVEVAVLELGMSNLGEIHTLADCARPDVALITNIGLSHIENLKTQENILKAKMEITDFFGKDNVLVVNAEDKFLKEIKENSFKVIKTGYDDNNMIRAYDIVLKEDSTSFKVRENGKEYNFVLPMVGAHNVLNALLGIAGAKELGVSYEEMLAGLKTIEATSMRLEFKEANDYIIINDCYNASPDSMKAALDVLKNRKGRRKIAILGTMRELGDESKRAHREVGEYAKDTADILVTTGEYVKDYEAGFGKENIIIYDSKEKLIDDISNIVQKDDVILVKASRGAKFEEIVTKLEK